MSVRYCKKCGGALTGGWCRKCQAYTSIGRAALLLALCTLAGCSTLTQPDEIGWQLMHAVDAAQTYSIVGSPCFEEGDPITRELIGRDPSHEEVIAWAVGMGALHAGVSHWLREAGHEKSYRAWQWVTLTGKGITVGKNYGYGIRVGSDNTGCVR